MRVFGFSLFPIIALSISAAAADLPLDLNECCNRNAKAAWPNQEPYGYREWLPPIIEFQETIFQLPDKERVIVLKPKESIRIDLPKPVEIESIAILCSANFVYKEVLKFRVELFDGESKSGKPFDGIAHEWYPWVDFKALYKKHVVKKLNIYSDDRMTMGLLGSDGKEFHGLVQSIRIVNDRAKNRQHLLIAAITLKCKSRVLAMNDQLNRTSPDATLSFNNLNPLRID